MALSQREFWVLDPHNDAAALTMGNDFTTTPIPSSAKVAMRGSY